MQPTVLFIDDEPRILRAMQRLLRPHSKVLVAESGLEALELLSLENVDVIVCDQRMPGMTGVEVLAEARRLSPRSMRILLTGYADLDAAVNALNQGHIYRYLNKPWTNEVLIETVQEAARIAMATPRLSAAREVADEITAEQQRPAHFLADTARREVAVLVLDNGNDLNTALEPLSRAGVRLHQAHNVDTAQVLLDQQAVGVALINAVAVGGATTELVNQIREQYPEVMMIVVSREADIAHLAGLINAGSIYRFLPHPLDERVVQASVKAALAKHIHQRSRNNSAPEPDPQVEEDIRAESSANAELLFNHGGNRGWFSRLISLFRPGSHP